MKNQTPIGAHKAVPREDFKYKNEWRKAQEKEREEDDRTSEASLILMGGFLMVFLKMMALAATLRVSHINDHINGVFYPAIGFAVAATLNILGNKLKSYKKTRITGTLITILSYAVFVAFMLFLVTSGGN